MRLHHLQRQVRHALRRRHVEPAESHSRTRAHVVDGFAARHRIVHLVWFEQHETMEAAITREKRIKKWNRDWKLNLIERENPEWLDLAIGLGFEPLMR